jgi:hypothetical protein
MIQVCQQSICRLHRAVTVRRGAGRLQEISQPSPALLRCTKHDAVTISQQCAKVVVCTTVVRKCHRPWVGRQVRCQLSGLSQGFPGQPCSPCTCKISSHHVADACAIRNLNPTKQHANKRTARSHSMLRALAACHFTQSLSATTQGQHACAVHERRHHLGRQTACANSTIRVLSDACMHMHNSQSPSCRCRYLKAHSSQS